MSPVALSTLLALAAATSSALAQGPEGFQPLAEKRFNYPDVPFKVDTDNGLRGTQFGYNLCNSTTEGPESLCQTAFVNHADDWCVWGPPEPNSLIGDTEGEAVAWCTKPGRGTRIIPAGAITGLQYIKTPGYIQVVGFIDQTKINIADGDTGGEMDPHGADLRGNPLGGIVFSNGFGSNTNNDTFVQAVEWHNFMGSNQFCMKVCDPADPQAPRLCEHIYDRVGVLYNCPHRATNGVFEACEGENQDPPGIYTENGQVMTYTQPAESLGPISTIPYEPRIPASSNCVPFQSNQLFADLPAATGAPGASSGTGSGAGPAPTGTGAGTGAGSAPTRTGSGTTPGATGGASEDENGAASTRISMVAAVAGAVAAFALLV